MPTSASRGSSRLGRPEIQSRPVLNQLLEDIAVVVLGGQHDRRGPMNRHHIEHGAVLYQNASDFGVA